MNEIDALMRMDTGGVLIYEGNSAAFLAQFNEWLRTPVGSVWGLPAWGNTLTDFRHEPSGNSTEIAIEAALITKLKQDIPDLPLKAIRCITQTGVFDLYRVEFLFPFGAYAANITSEGLVL
ncbi:TPA: hypothetical protein JD836_14620 [Citrobacter freundii]|nr:hypothetical protein [Citrobacter freundii]HCD1268032.1 hypothetical protein [Citrobacter freundii]